MANLGGNIVTIVVTGFTRMPRSLKFVFNASTTSGHYEQSSMLAAGANLASTMEALQQQAMATAAPLSDDLALPFLDLEEVFT